MRNGNGHHHHHRRHQHRNGHRPHHDPPTRVVAEPVAPEVRRVWPVIVVGAFAVGVLLSLMSLRR